MSKVDRTRANQREQGDRARRRCEGEREPAECARRGREDEREPADRARRRREDEREHPLEEGEVSDLMLDGSVARVGKRAEHADRGRRSDERARERQRREDERQRRDDEREQLRLHEAQRPSSAVGFTDPTTIDVGASAEDRAAAALEDNGYEIIERNYRCDVGELDIVAREGRDLVFVEVRSRSSSDYGDASEAVGRGKQRKVSKVAEVYLRHKRPYFEGCRFDVVAINGDDVEIYKDAWRGGLLF